LFLNEVKSAADTESYLVYWGYLVKSYLVLKELKKVFYGQFQKA